MEIPGVQTFLSLHTFGDTLVGEGPGIRISLDNGGTWQELTYPDLPILTAQAWKVVHFGRHGLFVNVPNAWFDNPDQPLMRTRDLGKTWEALTMTFHTNGAEWGEGIVFARRSGGVEFFNPATGSFTPMDDGLPEGGYPAVAGDGRNLFAMKSWGDCHRYDAGSQAWKPMASPAGWGEGMFRFRGGAAFWGEFDSTRQFMIRRSEDAGASWTPVAAFPSHAVQGFLPMETGFLTIASGIGIGRYAGPGADLVPDNAGLQASDLQQVQAYGDGIFTWLGGSGWIYRSDNLGKDWTLLSRDFPVSYGVFLPAAGDLFFSDEGTLRRYSHPEGRFDTVPRPPGMIFWDLKDGGDRFYALASTPGEGSRVDYFLSSSPKAKLQWTPLNPPDSGYLALDAQGPIVLAFGPSKGAWSPDGGMTWNALGGLPFAKANQVACSPGRWMVFSERGIFVAPHPSGPWTHSAFNGEVRLAAISGGNIVVTADSTRMLLSRDTGRTWTEVASPLPIMDGPAISVSDKTLCLGRLYRKHYCSDMATLPIPVGRPIAARARPASPMRFQGTWRVILSPAAPGSLPREADFLGRESVLGRPHRAR